MRTWVFAATCALVATSYFLSESLSAMGVFNAYLPIQWSVPLTVLCGIAALLLLINLSARIFPRTLYSECVSTSLGMDIPRAQRYYGSGVVFGVQEKVHQFIYSRVENYDLGCYEELLKMQLIEKEFDKVGAPYIKTISNGAQIGSAFITIAPKCNLDELSPNFIHLSLFKKNDPDPNVIYKQLKKEFESTKKINILVVQFHHTVPGPNNFTNYKVPKEMHILLTQELFDEMKKRSLFFESFPGKEILTIKENSSQITLVKNYLDPNQCDKYPNPEDQINNFFYWLDSLLGQNPSPRVENKLLGGFHPSPGSSAPSP